MQQQHIIYSISPLSSDNLHCCCVRHLPFLPQGTTKPTAKNEIIQFEIDFLS